MGTFLTIHPINPQAHLLSKAVVLIKAGAVIVYPTDSGYALACRLGDKKALDRIRMIRHLKEDHPLTLVCRDLSELSTYAMVSDEVFHLLKVHTPGPYTFILPATREVPRKFMHPKRKTIGLRIPDNIIAQGLLDLLDEPLMSTTLTLPDEEVAFLQAETIRDILGNQVDLIIDGGSCGLEPTTIIDLSGEKPVVVRKGKGDVEPFL
jgi:tRNA threonylcarbamoyl adenosine modification protein (Sua5/YciO/YrdC/YwlC family)